MREQSYRRDGNGDIAYEKVELPTIPGVDHRMDIVVIEDHHLMNLPEYSTTNPTGVYVNKLWRRDGRPRVKVGSGWHLTPDPTEPPRWIVCEYAPHRVRPDLCRVVTRLAASPETIELVAEGVLWWLS